MPISKNELTKEMIAKAMQCQTAEELIVLAKSEGIELTKEEAEAYLEEFSDVELDETSLQHVAGGAYNPDCNNNNAQKCYKN
jgi:predicted ribosomally synthesized peptide with nif11-like leader